MQSAAVSSAAPSTYLNLSAVEVRPAQPDEVDFCQQQLEEHHYLGRAAPVGDRFWQVVEHAGERLGVLLWCAAAKRLKPREDWIGWDARTRVERLKLVVQNSRFCLWRTQPNLASRVLGEAARVLPEQWQRVHGYTPLLAESFVDPAHFAGTCYRAAGWEQAGRSRGTRRAGADYYLPGTGPKLLLLKPLRPDAVSLLRGPAEALPPQCRRAEPVAALYEAGRVRHCGQFARLEDELCGLMAGGGWHGPARSPDRADALVWAMHELLLNPRAEPRVRTV